MGSFCRGKAQFAICVLCCCCFWFFLVLGQERDSAESRHGGGIVSPSGVGRGRSPGDLRTLERGEDRKKKEGPIESWAAWQFWWWPAQADGAAGAAMPIRQGSFPSSPGWGSDAVTRSAAFICGTRVSQNLLNGVSHSQYYFATLGPQFFIVRAALCIAGKLISTSVLYPPTVITKNVTNVWGHCQIAYGAVMVQNHPRLRITVLKYILQISISALIKDSNHRDNHQ